MSPFKHSDLTQDSRHDVEKQIPSKASPEVNITASPTATTDVDPEHISEPTLFRGRLAQWNAKVEGLSSLEARGITRVLPEHRFTGGLRGHVQMVLLWFSINLVANNIITGLFGPLVFALGWTDSVCIVVFAYILGVAAPAYMATFGPESGNRAMILSRFFFGYWPSKISAVFNLIQQIGFGIIGCIVAGQIISAVNGNGLTIAVGCIIAALCIGLLATFGISVLHTYERYAFIPQLIVLFVLVGSAAKEFDVSATSQGAPGTITANRCSFFALSYGNSVGWAAVAPDFYVYYPVGTNKYATFCATLLGAWIAFVFCNILGIGVATAIPNVPAWAEAYDVSTLRGLGGFGGLCAVILALGSVTNNAPGTYNAANTFQVLGRYTEAIPRWMWCVVITIVELVCSVAGRNHLFAVFQNFLPIMSYWISPWVTIIVEEHFFFHYLRGRPFDWSAWEDKEKLPVGIAALSAWLCAWAGAIVGMQQVWYQGPLALKVGNYGGDIGAWLSIAIACVIYPPLRYLELKKLGR
ncbi:MAG: hypothetical protein Q9174_000030 [Haloplaca sp. 1 TL-2023]